MQKNSVVVVVPIYRDTGLTELCLRSAMRGIDRVQGAVLVAIDDCSPEPDMGELLDRLQIEFGSKLVVIRNSENLGFVRTANIGLAYSTSADVVLLNNDVLTCAVWLERLVEDAYSDEKAGTVTPLSNNTTITSFPNFLADNVVPLGLDLDEINRAFDTPRSFLVATPTGVGFCMYIKRACIESVGLLDEISFGTGYGEENDFCQRALEHGWINYISPNLYVYHKGGVSFGSAREERLRDSEKVLDRRYPRYHSDVQAFVVQDKLRQTRWERYLDIVRISEQPVVLHIGHGLGGGVTQHINDLTHVGHGRAVSFILQPQGDGKLLSLAASAFDTSMAISIDVETGAHQIGNFLRDLNISLVHFHHVLGLPEKIISALRSLPAKKFFTCHDYYLINANPTLTGADGVFDLDKPDGSQNPLYPLPAGVSGIEWRGRYQILVSSFDRVIFPSWAAFDLFSRFFLVRASTIAFHTSAAVEPRASGLLAEQRGRKLRVGVLGALSREKGAEILESAAESARRRDLNLEFVLIGYAFRFLKGVESTGAYTNDDALKLIGEQRCDAILFPALWPETFSYTLSVAMLSGLPIIAPSIGAFPERLAGRSAVYLFPHPTDGLSLSVQIDEFLRDPGSVDSTSHSMVGKSAQHDFYEAAYWSEMVPPGSMAPRQNLLKSFDALWQLREENTKSGRERLLRILWPVYTHPMLQGFFRLIPHRLKRLLKRSLSNKPLHEILSKR